MLLFIILAIFAEFIAPFDPNATMVPFAFPGAEMEDGRVFLLGTDHLGRDILSRIIFGGQRVLFYATVATVAAYVVGILMGLAAGYFRGTWTRSCPLSPTSFSLSRSWCSTWLIIAKVGASGINIIFAVVFASRRASCASCGA